MSLYGDIISEAMGQHKNHIAEAMLKQCTSEQIGQADPHLLVQAAWNKNTSMMYGLASKGINANPNVDNLIRVLANSHDEYAFNVMLDLGLNIENDNYSALHACISYNSIDMGKALLEHGMSFDGYSEWRENNGIAESDSETFDALKEHWENEVNIGQDEDAGMSMM